MPLFRSYKSRIILWVIEFTYWGIVLLIINYYCLIVIYFQLVEMNHWEYDLTNTFTIFLYNLPSYFIVYRLFLNSILSIWFNGNPQSIERRLTRQESKSILRWDSMRIIDGNHFPSNIFYLFIIYLRIRRWKNVADYLYRLFCSLICGWLSPWNVLFLLTLHHPSIE